MGAEAAERARLVEDYWQRKREAADNKARGNYDYQPSVCILISYQVFKDPLLTGTLCKPLLLFTKIV